ncbi:MAG: hypothetical protein KAW41_00215 [Candidatus Diapherotrites archaeon]|nr:hypothetical protein [Candidatus Diapherotrites archaeon]
MLSPKQLFFILAFSVLVLVGSQINFSPLLGADNQFFTLFQFFGPTAGAFLGPVVGAASVLLAQLANFVLAGKEVTIINLFRLTPMLFAAAYFGSKGLRQRYFAVIPLLAMAAFWLHPVGQEACWFYALYWLIPIVVTLKPGLVSRSVGATFTAHAVGSVAFLYAVPTTAALWIGLIPVVALERGLFSLGIAGSYVVFNTVMARLELPVFDIDKRYVLSKKLLLG